MVCFNLSKHHIEKVHYTANISNTVVPTNVEFPLIRGRVLWLYPVHGYSLKNFFDFSGLFPRNFATTGSTKNTVANAECIQQNKGSHYTPATNANPCARGNYLSPIIN